MRSALIIGGRGQCGRAIAERLIVDGWDVTATSSQPVADGPPEVKWTSQSHAQIAGEFDVVVDCLAYTREDAEELLAFGERIGSAVVISTVAVYTDQHGRSMEDPELPRWPIPVPVGQPVLAPGEGYARGKAAVEATLRERASWPVTILRPAAIHGRRSRHLREWYFIKRVLDRRSQVILPYEGRYVLQPAAVLNLAELVALAAAKPGGRVLNCGDLDPPTPAQISEIIDGVLGWQTDRVLIKGPPPSPTVGAHPWCGPRDVILDMTTAEQELGYRQPLTYAEAISDTVEWAVSAVGQGDWRQIFSFLAKYPADLFDYEAEDAYLASAGGAVRGR